MSPSRATLARLARFAVVGSIGFVIDAGGLMLLLAAGAPPLPARVGSILFALYVTWRLNRQVTFRTTRAPTLAEFAHYAGVGAGSSLLNFVVYAVLLASGAITSPLLATAAGSIAAMAATYWGLDRFVFRSARP